MVWKRNLLFGFGAIFVVLVGLGWFTAEGLFDPPRSPPSLTAEQRDSLHPDTVAGFDEYGAGKYQQAVALWLRRAEANDAEAQFWLARMYDFGHGVRENSGIANEWYERSVNLGNPKAMYNLAYVYSDGEGVERDPTAAFRLWQRAANLGLARAQYSLARTFLKGLGVTENPGAAAFWYKKAASQGHIWALGMLANAYLLGDGIERDLEQALKYDHIAARLGNPRVRLTMAITFLLTSQEQRERAKRRGDAWLKEFRDSGRSAIR
jgi:TPR repeat protein